MPAAARVIVLLPTYDEIANLEWIAGRIRSALPDADLLILDDDSPDGTGELADRIAARDEHVRVVHRTVKAGLGAAYVDGFRRAIADGYDVIVEIDADGSHPPESLPAMIAEVEGGAALAIGSRWVPGGSIVGWPKRRELLSRAGNLYTRIALGIRVQDATAGFRAYASRVIAAMDLDSIDSKGYCFQVDMTYRLARAGERIVEVPIEFREREHGVSKMSGAIVVEAMRRVTRWGLQRLVGAEPR
ncbi:polyprenol monophosphomannose synthase [Galbitalea sp. SE-J8]|uniref:polyprenol monophosphomannose synthase n=1 Tax=Galbitalea sp. SE-J8 TaxID=3054952 RepID=UPI00259CE1FD|nr:polyprenol monophosphomannose synthase [Galbitalea sp. SE-J8]MDM4763653.1 polyprenol monophosphomannose synthase [Galbitalea sp. SE-J8]